VLAAYLCRLRKRKNLAAIVCGLRPAILRSAFCVLCRWGLTHKASQERPAGLFHTIPAKTPWEQISIDLIGPLPRFAGHAWLLVMQDRFTKWIELSSFRRAITLAIVQRLTTQIIFRHGCLDYIRQRATICSEDHVETRRWPLLGSSRKPPSPRIAIP